MLQMFTFFSLQNGDQKHHNFGKSGPIYKIISLQNSSWNFLHNYRNDSPPHLYYLVKLKNYRPDCCRISMAYWT